jgi:hypothetical protein
MPSRCDEERRDEKRRDESRAERFCADALTLSGTWTCDESFRALVVAATRHRVSAHTAHRTHRANAHGSSRPAAARSDHGFRCTRRRAARTARTASEGPDSPT